MTKLNTQSLHFTLGQPSDCREQHKEALDVCVPKQQLLVGLLISCAMLIIIARSVGQPISADINVKLQPVVEHIDLVTDINIVGNTLFICTQPGQVYRKNLSANGAPEVFLDLRSEVGRLGSHIPG